MKRTRKLIVEQLEDRTVPTAGPGLPWADPAHLTLSFAPDGTAVGTETSVLFRDMNLELASAPANWQEEILRAFQTWAVNANINIGIVNDGGQALGANGAVQFDPRFGDIRIVASSLSPDVIAVSVPFDPASGTLSGDVNLNQDYYFGEGTLTPPDLFSVAIHEAGVVFGMPENTDPNSVMDVRLDVVRGPNLPATDVSSIQAMYGARQADAFDRAASNDTLATASSLSNVAVGGVGFAAVADGDVTTLSDLDYYTFQTAGTTENYTITAQSAGRSLLMPRLSVFDSTGQLISSTVGTQWVGNTLQISIASAAPNTTYYVKVESGTQDVFGIGSYRLTIMSDSATLPSTSPNTGASFPSNDNHSNDTISTATLVQPLAPGADLRYDFLIQAGINDTSDVDYYKVQAPAQSNGVMTVTLWSQTGSTLKPKADVFNSNGSPLSANVLVDETGTYVVQVSNITSGAFYYVKIAALDSAGGNATGTYSLGLNFHTPYIGFQNLESGQLAGVHKQDLYKLTVGHDQLFHFRMQASKVGTQTDTAVRMYIYDSNGHLIASLFAAQGQQTTLDDYLAAGTYSLRIVGASKNGPTLQGVGYTLSGLTLSHPIGPEPINPLNPDPLLTDDFTLDTINDPTLFTDPINPFTDPLIWTPPVPPPPSPP